MTTKILLVKLGALGDVLRTTTVLDALKKKFKHCHITWVVDTTCESALKHISLIDKIIPFSYPSLENLKRESFDISINLDKEKEALDTVMSVPSKQKMGFGRNEKGELVALDTQSDYALKLGIDDELKFSLNQKSYQQITFEQLGLSFNQEEYQFHVDKEHRHFAAELLTSLGVDPTKPHRPIVGLNTGSGHRFAGKKLPLESFAKLADKIHEELGVIILLLGGEDELSRNKVIAMASRAPVVNTGSHDIHRFAGIVSYCDLVVTADTTAMHIAIATKVPTVTFFGSTSAPEIELYGRGKKILSKLECAPCYKKLCPIDEQCMKEMSVDELFNATKELLQPKLAQLKA